MQTPDAYLARFPAEHRPSADRAYQDGFADGAEADAPPDAKPLRSALLAAAFVLERDFEAAALAGDTDRRTRRAAQADALKQLANDSEAVGLVAKELAHEA